MPVRLYYVEPCHLAELEHSIYKGELIFV